jgi:hypothetical protein
MNHQGEPLRHPDDLSLEELRGYAARLFPNWSTLSRERYVEKVARDRGFSIIFRALQRIDECYEPDKIRFPWALFGKVIRDVAKGRGGS